MNNAHKCHFHKNNNITKFCTNTECTLPLCHECEPIHIQEHQQNYTQPSIVRFNEAYLKAVNDIQDFLEFSQKQIKIHQEKINTDKNELLTFISQYFQDSFKKIQPLSTSIEEAKEKLAKIKKGSIKTLIFFYSGEIKLTTSHFQYEPIVEKVRQSFKNKGQNFKNEIPRLKQFGVKPDYEEELKKRVQARMNRNASTTNIDYSNHQHKSAVQDNVFNQIQMQNKTRKQKQLQKADEGQKDRKDRERNRRGIFEHAKKESKIAQEIIKENKNEVRLNKGLQMVQNEEEEGHHYDPSPKFNHYDKYPIDNKIYDKYQVELKNFNHQSQFENPPISFENRYSQKINAVEQYDNFLKERNKNINKIEQRFNQVKLQKEVFDYRPLKTSDLEIPHETDANTYLKTNIQRSRTLSHTNLPNYHREEQKTQHQRQTANNIYDLDMKKQVLSPEEIRKMLEKRIQQRNRILSIKKNEENYPQPINPNTFGRHTDDKFGNNNRKLFEEKERKPWDTKDSIINQIYNDSRY